VPVAANGEPVLVFVHVRIGAIRQPEVLRRQPRGDGKDRVGVGRPGDFLAEPVQELEQRFAVDPGFEAFVRAAGLASCAQLENSDAPPSARLPTTALKTRVLSKPDKSIVAPPWHPAPPLP
jgi:hypothetical protein